MTALLLAAALAAAGPVACPGVLLEDLTWAMTYSASGVFGDATLATKEKGKIVTEAPVEAILSDIESLRRASPKQD